MCSSRKYPYSPHRGDWNFLGIGGSVRPKMHVAYLAYSGWEGLRRNPFCGGGTASMWIFWNYKI